MEKQSTAFFPYESLRQPDLHEESGDFSHKILKRLEI
jgi:hypothetical protein